MHNLKDDEYMPENLWGKLLYWEPVENVIFKETVILNRPCVLCWALYLGFEKLVYY